MPSDPVLRARSSSSLGGISCAKRSWSRTLRDRRYSTLCDLPGLIRLAFSERRISRGALLNNACAFGAAHANLHAAPLFCCHLPKNRSTRSATQAATDPSCPCIAAIVPHSPDTLVCRATSPQLLRARTLRRHRCTASLAGLSICR